MGGIVYFFASVAALVLIGGTLRTIRANLIYRPAADAGWFSSVGISVFEFLLWINCVVAAVVAMPHPITIILVALIVGSLISACVLRYREETMSMNRWLRMGSADQSPLPELLDSLASGCRSGLALKAKSCVRRLQRGESLADAARRARLPLDADTIAFLAIETNGAATVETNADVNQNLIASAEPTSQALVASPGRDIHRLHESWKTASRIVHQMTYVVLMILLAWLLGLFIENFLVPTFEEMLEEFGMNNRHFDQLRDGFRWVTFLGQAVAILMLLWLAISFLIRWLPLWSVRLVPWFGPRAINRWRAQVLRSLGRGMSTNQSEQRLLGFTARSTRTRWIRSRCRMALGILEGGVSLPDALRHGRFISESERTWLACANKNGSLPQSLQKLSDDILRRDTYRWNVRMSWLVPLTTVLVGFYVLVHAAFLFHCLSRLMSFAT